MARLVAMYKSPPDPAAFDRHYYSTHVPLAKQIPGLRSYEASVGAVATPRGPSPYHLIAILAFDSRAAMQAALDSREGKATAADLASFAQAGVELLVFESKEI